MTEPTTPRPAFASHRLLLLHECFVGLVALPPAELVDRARRDLAWIFDGSALEHESESMTTTPRAGRTQLPNGRWVWRLRVQGPDGPQAYRLHHPGLHDPNELRLVALWAEFFAAALSASLYREHAEALALRDPLTGLLNRRGLERVQHLRGPSHWVGVYDLDELKKTNDREGHAAGDRLLLCFARWLATTLGDDARAFRVGGDEFAVVCSRTERETLDRSMAPCGVRVSVGWARADETGTLDGVLRIADARMYEVKAARAKRAATAQERA